MLNWILFMLLAAVIAGLMMCVGSLFDEVDMLREKDEDDHVDVGF